MVNTIKKVINPNEIILGKYGTTINYKVYYVKNIYLCEDCFYNKYLPRIKDLKQKRRLIRDYKVSIDLLPENCYNVNLKNMWGLKNE